MKEGADFHSPPPPDDPHDPLLAALRKHLGENFGQEPPAALWAGIRQQLPGAPRPWWRSRRLLPLLALLVGIVALGVFSARQGGWLGGHATTTLATNKSTESSHLQITIADNKVKTIASQSTDERASNKLPRVTSAPNTAPQSRTALGPQPGLNPATSQAPVRGARARKATAVAISTGEQPSATMREPTAKRVAEALPTAERKRTRRLATLRRAQSHLSTPGQQHADLATAQSFDKALSTSAQAPATSASAEPSPRSLANDVAANRIAASGSARKRSRRPAARRSIASDVADADTGLALPVAATASNRSPRATPVAASEARTAGVMGPATSRPSEAFDSLASRRATLLLAAQNLPAALSPTADSIIYWVHPARRWSVLVLAGPTLSFRTMRSVNAGGLVSSSPTATPTQSFNGLNGTRTTSTNVVDLERPAAGRSAQVQVRRVLTGRWAIAFGAGYQEYATRLALQVTKRTPLLASPASSVSYFDSTFSVRHRDTYQLLTLPLQLSYALGPPRGRLSINLLGGLEPSWYVGGRTTEGTSCNCEQQSFNSASSSPYNAFSLGLSLGLDARYRLGGPASRWQWVLQPTGRYVASPFVRSSTLYARRQPYSFGLLTGLAWEF